MNNNALFTIEQVDNKLIITVEAVKPEHPNPTMIRSNDGDTETIEFVDPPLTINTDRNDNCSGLDLSKYKAFPMGYVVSLGKKVILLEDTTVLSKGTIGTVKTWWGHMATVAVDCIEVTVSTHKLAPLDPSDHPDYKAEEPESRPMNAEEIGAWIYRNAGVTRSFRDRAIDKINQHFQYELNKAKR